MLPQRVPPAPSAAALERYALMPVNEAAGTPTISIPFYEARSGQLSAPISISYHASGIRVDDQASWVGLSWALNAGGVITRVARGLGDERPGGFSEHYGHVPDRDAVNQYCDDHNLFYQCNLPLAAIANRQLDYQPDLYTFNLLGESGTFMQGNDGRFHTLSMQPVAIVARDSAFVLTNAQGIRYEFGIPSTTTTRSTSHMPPVKLRSTWYLTRVVSANKADTIQFEYVNHSVTSQAVQQQATFITQVSGTTDRIPLQPYTETLTTITQGDKKLTKILFKEGAVFVAMAADRHDVRSDRRLVSLTVVARNASDTLKQMRFYQSYFRPGGGLRADSASFLRLRLDSIGITAPGIRLPVHRFTYNTAHPLPRRLYGSRDHWGYSNGAPSIISNSGNALLIPVTEYQDLYGQRSYPGANREPVSEFTQSGMLTEITYPTGGKQAFSYEPNTVGETVLIPNPTITVISNATTTGDGAGAATFVRDTARFTITYPVNAACTINIGVAEPEDGHPAPPRSDAYATLVDVTAAQRTTLFSNSRSASATPLLQVGHRYQLITQARGLASVTMVLTYKSTTLTYATRNVVTGGLRLREEHVQAASHAPVTCKRYYYHTPGTSASSAYFIAGASPVYSRLQKTRLASSTTLRNTDITYTVLSSAALAELSGSDRVVGYKYVTVRDSASSGEVVGETVSCYRGASDALGGWSPPIPQTSFAGQRDQLLTQKIYSSAANGRVNLLSKVVNDYVVRDTLQIVGFSASAADNIQDDVSQTAYTEGLRPYAYANSIQSINWIQLSRSRRYQYAPADTNTCHLTTTTYRYGNPSHQQATLIEKTLTNGQRQQTRFRYAADYDVAHVTANSSVAAQAVRELVHNHALAQLVEQTVTNLTEYGDTLVTQSTLTLFKILAPGVVLPAQQLSLQLAIPVQWHSFRPSRLQGANLLTDPRYESRMTFDHYDNDRNLAQAHLSSGLPTSYLWDTNTGEPLAKATARIWQLAYSSFEPGATGRWQYSLSQAVAGQSRTGAYAYALDGQGGIRRDSIPAGEYELSIWLQGRTLPQLGLIGGATASPPQYLANTAKGWQQVRIRLRFTTIGSIRLNASGGGTIMIDDLVLQPVGAQLSSYTYDALRGMTSQTDASGRTTTYEYDAMGRLVRTRDEQGRILSQQQYHYAKP